jgi:hypothetical protein
MLVESKARPSRIDLAKLRRIRADAGVYSQLQSFTRISTVRLRLAHAFASNVIPSPEPDVDLLVVGVDERVAWIPAGGRADD